MPPKKNSIPTVNKVQKAKRGKVVKEKQKSKTPNSITISISNTKSAIALASPAPDLPQWNVRHLGLQAKIDLANEVAHRQLVKTESIEITQPTVTPLPAKKRGRRKKETVVSDFFENKQDEASTPTEPPVPDPPKKARVRKPPAKIASTEKPVIRKRTATPTVPKPIKRPKLTPNAQSTTVNNKPKCKNNVPATRVLRNSTKGKIAENSTDARDGSPSILDNITPKIEIIPCVTDVEPNDVSVSCKIEKRETPTDLKVGRSIDLPETSLTSNSSLSWTKDISSTTTCVTVSSKDFVRFNKKMPIVKLRNIDSSIPTRKTEPDVEISSSSDSECESKQECKCLSDDVDAKSINLSISSAPNSPNGKKNPSHDDAVEKLVSTMKKIDLEIINWFSFKPEDVTADLVRLKDKMFDILNSEFGIINHCQHLKRLLDPQPTHNDKLEDFPSVPINTNKDIEIVKPSTINRPCKNPEIEKAVIVPAVIQSDDVAKETDDSVNIACEAHYVPPDNYDDDDALSLFAESITGIDSSRVDTSVGSTRVTNNEEYVPTPVANVPSNKYSYRPSKINEDNPSVKSSIVCEKQNADSTSIHKEIVSKSDAPVYASKDRFINEHVRVNNVGKWPKPSLLAAYFEPMPYIRSVVFKGVCIFYLMKCCKKAFHGQVCGFPHVTLTSQNISDRLSKLSEEIFIQEYLLIRNTPDLRRLYGLCFVAECVKRDLTSMLVEMALDFVIKAKPGSEEDSELKVNVAEMALLYLNKVPLTECENILKIAVEPSTMLCDFFMRTLAVTFNFSRFRPVFVSLTAFMVREGRTFALDVVGQILERVCILAFDRALAGAVLSMMRCTSPKIFEVTLIRCFEKQISIDGDIYEEYLAVKRGAGYRSDVSPIPSNVSSPRPPLVHSDATRSDGEDRGPQAPSPDTTNLDSLNKKMDEPKITRTIDFNRPNQFTTPMPFRPPDNQKIVRKVLNWRTNGPTMMRPPIRHQRPMFTPQMGFPMRPPPKRPQRLVTYTGCNLNFMHRRPPPNY